MNKTPRILRIEQKFGMSLEELLKQKYEVEKKSTVEIAEMVCVTNTTVGRWLYDYNIPVRSVAESRFGPSKNPGEKQLKQWYEVEKKSTFEIAELVSVGNSTVSRWLRYYRIPLRSMSEIKLNGRKKPSEVQLRQWYEVEKKSTYKVAELIGVSATAVVRWMQDYKIPIKVSKNPGEERLRQWYELERKNTFEIAELIGVSSVTVGNWLHDYNIPVRNYDSSRALKAKALEEVVRRIVR
jgi:transposase